MVHWMPLFPRLLSTALRATSHLRSGRAARAIQNDGTLRLFQTMWVLGFLPFVALGMTEQRADAQVPNVGFCNCNSRSLEPGNFLGTYLGADNPTSSPVTFTITMNSNMFFGPEHVVHMFTVGANDGFIQTDCSGINTTCDLPLGTDHIVLSVTTSATGDQVVNTCEFDLTVAAPILSCPGDIRVATDPGACSAIVNYTPPTLPGKTVSSSPPPGSSFPKGQTTVTCTATPSGPCGAITCTFTVTVDDAEPPQLICPADVSVDADPGACSAPVALAPPTGMDNCDGPIAPTGVRSDGLSLSDPYPVGNTTVTWTAMDAAQHATSCTQKVTVVSQTPPTIRVALTPSVLWPPNHRLAAIHADVQATDPCDPQPTVRLLSVTSDEPDNGAGDGDTPGDIQNAELGSSDFDFLVRAERSGGGDGRHYLVCYEAVNQFGLIAQACATILVPNDRQGRGLISNGTRGLELVVFGSTKMPAQSIDPGSARVGTGAFEPIVLGGQVGFLDWDGDGVEDAMIPFAEQGVDGAEAAIEAAHRIAVGVFARWTVGGTGYVAQVDGADVVGVADLGPTRLRISVLPNPTVSFSEFRYGLPKAGPVHLSVYDVAGREVARLVDGERSAGEHVVRWEPPRGAAASIYLYRLQAHGQVLRGRVAVMR